MFGILLAQFVHMQTQSLHAVYHGGDAIALRQAGADFGGISIPRDHHDV